MIEKSRWRLIHSQDLFFVEVRQIRKRTLLKEKTENIRKKNVTRFLNNEAFNVAA